MGSLLQKSLPLSTLVVAIDPSRAANRGWRTRDDPELVVTLGSRPSRKVGGDEYPPPPPSPQAAFKRHFFHGNRSRLTFARKRTRSGRPK